MRNRLKDDVAELYIRLYDAERAIEKLQDKVAKLSGGLEEAIDEYR